MEQQCSPEDVGLSTAGLEVAFEAFRSCGLPGGVFTVSRRGSHCFVRSFGVRDVDTGAPMETDTSFAIHSQTKIVTSLATARLVERGLLGVDDPVSLYLPEMAKERLRVCNSDATAKGFDAATGTVPCSNSMTVRHLLTHTSGLTYGLLFGRPKGDAMQPAHAMQHWGPRTAKDFAAIPLCFQPGTQFRYSGATALLGLVLEAILHQPLSTIIQTEVLVPLGMHNTGFALDGLHNLATPYVATSSRADEKNTLGAALNCFMERDPGVAITSAATLTPGGRVLQGRPAGDTGLYSTPADWAKLMSCLQQQGKGLLRQETFEFFHAPSTPDLDDVGGYNSHFSDQGSAERPPQQGLLESGSPHPTGEHSSGPQMYHSIMFGGIAHNLMSLVVTSEANCLGASRGTFGWSGLCGTNYEIDPVEDLVVTWWAAVAPCWRYNVKGLCLPHVFAALTEPNVPHPYAHTSPTAWRAPSRL